MDYTPFSTQDIHLYPPGLSQFFTQLGVNSGASFVMGKEILTGLLCIFLFFYLIVSGALFYHWAVYGMRNKYIIFAEISFTLVSVFLLWTALVIISTL